MKTHHEIIVIGAGFSGIGVAIKLRERGFDDFIVVDEATGPGGTWHWNTYPGIAVDIPSFSYQYSFEKRPTWSRTYAKGAELKSYAEYCVDKYELRPHIRFGVSIVAADYDDDRTLWRLTTESGDVLTARFVINAAGVLTRPKLPDIDGIDTFAGVKMHTSRWNHSIDLRGKKVGIIGTGASAVQVIPEIAPQVAHLTVFQRTPIWCMPKLDVPIATPAKVLLKRLPGGQQLARLASQAFVEVTFPIAAHYNGIVPAGKAGERIGRAFLRKQVRDPALRDKLTPRYGLGCKRPSFHNSYLATFNRPDVTLETGSITHVDAGAVHTVNGTHDLDVLILATGFKVADPGNMPTYQLHGRGGLELEQWWDANRLQAYEGVSVPEFPNHFSIFGPYGYNGSSYFALIEAQAHHIMRLLEEARSSHTNLVEVTRSANERFFAEMLARRKYQIFWQDSCASANSYYFDRHGDVPLRPTTTVESIWRSRHFDLKDYRFERV
ncbi:NAD(P)-binding domain-containing protein [Antrihabitans stalactiti]|uniref:NAD(P)/FAD-dependent oxidoreductase n=1 Tax=Antrihabitans stalactiti TaxID=2584121 RepID=A0A848KJK6_9NOCA|nr:NAD(P)/FAD-dependent oxidoreductase [Antrihabitans stalactiti]